MKELDIGKDFHTHLGSRYRKDGPASGEEWREDHLLPALLEHDRVVVKLDAIEGPTPSFFEEAFGGVVRSLGRTVLARIDFRASRENVHMKYDCLTYMHDQVIRDLDEEVIELKAWQNVAIDSNNDVDDLLRTVYPWLPKHSGMPVDGVRKVINAYHHVAENLWQLLDDVDTTSDMAKSDDSAYRKRVERIQALRFSYFESDGYSLALRDPQHWPYKRDRCWTQCRDCGEEVLGKKTYCILCGLDNVVHVPWFNNAADTPPGSLDTDPGEPQEASS